jgi:NAD dependent epimerase/dehydratase family enzyme
VDDAVAAIRFAIERRLTGPVNVTAPRPVRNRAFATSAGRILRRPAWLSTPVFVLRLALGEQATLVCEGQQALPARLTEAGFHFRHPSLESALADLCT